MNEKPDERALRATIEAELEHKYAWRFKCLELASGCQPHNNTITAAEEFFAFISGKAVKPAKKISKPLKKRRF